MKQPDEKEIYDAVVRHKKSGSVQAYHHGAMDAFDVTASELTDDQIAIARTTYYIHTYGQQAYEHMVHAMQAGVSAELPISKSTEPKHLRVGVNSAMVDCTAIARILIEKGICTSEEYARAVILEMAREVIRYEKTIMQRFPGGPAITLEGMP